MVKVILERILEFKRLGYLGTRQEVTNTLFIYFKGRGIKSYPIRGNNIYNGGLIVSYSNIFTFFIGSNRAS